MARPKLPPYTDLDPAVRAAVEKDITSMDVLSDVERIAIMAALPTNGRTRHCAACGLIVIMAIAIIDGRPTGFGIHLDDANGIETLALLNEPPPSAARPMRVNFSLN